MDEGLESAARVIGMITGAALELAGTGLDKWGEAMEDSGLEPVPFTGKALKVAGKATEFIGRELGEASKG